MEALVRAVAAPGDDADLIARRDGRARGERRGDRFDREHRALVDPDGERRAIHHDARERDGACDGRAHRRPRNRGEVDSSMPRGVRRRGRSVRTCDAERSGKRGGPDFGAAMRRRSGRRGFGGRREQPGEEQRGNRGEQGTCTEPGGGVHAGSLRAGGRGRHGIHRRSGASTPTSAWARLGGGGSRRSGVPVPAP